MLNPSDDQMRAINLVQDSATRYYHSHNGEYPKRVRCSTMLIELFPEVLVNYDNYPLSVNVPTSLKLAGYTVHWDSRLEGISCVA
jgi:hypothetical protein